MGTVKDLREVAEALYFLGGGNVYIEEYGRMCWCPVHHINPFASSAGKKMMANPGCHSTACNNAHDAWVKVNGVGLYRESR